MFNIQEAEIMSSKLHNLLMIFKFYNSHKTKISENDSADYLLNYICKIADQLNVKFLEK